MRSVCFFFQVHQPYRLRTYRFFDIGDNHHYYDEYLNRSIINRVTEHCYIPMNNLLIGLIKKYGKKFKVSFSITGSAIDQMQQYAPAALKSFQELVATGNVELVAETYSHTLVALKDKDEFKQQVQKHCDKIEELFGKRPTSFTNTEMIYDDKIGEMVAEMGFKVMLTEGAKHILGWKSPNYLYCNAINPRMKVLLRNFRMSDDIAFRFSEQKWSEWPLTADKYVQWIKQVGENQETINVFVDYETFGEHQWSTTGIFDFMKALPAAIFKNTDFEFATPSEVANHLQPISAIHVPQPISWADEERDTTAWLGNDLQDEAFDSLYSLTEKIKHVDDPSILRDWQYLQTSDHFYYMCTKWFTDGEVHKYFNPYPSPYEAFMNFMNVLSDLMIRIDRYLQNLEKNKPKPDTILVTTI
ncbi:MAG: glycoside hydrolase family 57 protein [Bacteroidota bacterium]|nr:glycoside hydrolase family 57 protein [Bacteroidota bacterium]